MRAFWWRSITVRAAAQVVGVGLLVGLGFVLLTAYLTEKEVQRGVSQRLHELMTTVESTAKIACFTRDTALAAEVVAGLATNSEVYAAAILGGGELLAEHRKALSGGGRLRAEAGRLRMEVVSPFDAGAVVGEIVIDPDPEIVRQRVRDSGVFVALLLGGQLLAVVSGVTAAVLLWIVRPIKRMSDKLHVMDAHSVEAIAVPRGLENTEIERLVTDINQLGQRLSNSLAEEHRLYVEREVGERKYRAIVENADSGLFVLNRQREVESCNRAFPRLLGLPEGRSGQDGLDLLRLPWREPGALAGLIGQCVDHGEPVAAELEYLPEGQSVRWLSLTLTPIGERQAQGQLTDISRHKLAELSAQQEAMSDPLTGLLNRGGFLEAIEQEIGVCAVSECAGFAVLMVDLDGFRKVNESMGLASGDRILSITASRLRACVKSTDAIARLGSDAFGLVLRSASSERAAAAVGSRISVVLKGFFEVGSTPLQLGASIGMTLFPGDGDNAETLLRNAEMALEQARAGGSGRYCFFDFTMARNAEHRRRLESDLGVAVRRNELLIHLQPIADLSTRKVAGAEALIRWEHPQRGLIPPDIFIPLAEETGAINNIGLWLLEAVCQQLATWRKQGIDGYISINVSARQVPDGLPPITLIETVNRYGVSSANLVIEITESVFMGDSEPARLWLEAVHELGFRIFLDDFGTGYSSLSYIKRFPVDVLKIDKSFVRDMNEDNSDRALVVAIINMAFSLGVSVVAEGVETAQQLELLQSAGCRYAQGYFLSRPVPVRELDVARQHIEAQLA